MTEHYAEYHQLGEAKFRRLAMLSRNPDIAKIHSSFADYHAIEIKRGTQINRQPPVLETSIQREPAEADGS